MEKYKFMMKNLLIAAKIAVGGSLAILAAYELRLDNVI